MKHFVKALAVLLLVGFFDFSEVIAKTKNTWENYWAKEVCLDDQARAKKISAAFFKGRLHVVHKGSRNDKIYHHFYTDRWHGQTRIANQSTADTPVLAVTPDNLYMFHTSGGSGKDTRMWRSKFAGSFWEDDNPLPKDLQSNKEPAVVGDTRDWYGKNTVYLVFKGRKSSKLYYAVIGDKNGKLNASGVHQLKGQSTQTPVTLVKFGRFLHHVHEGKGQRLWYSRSTTAGYHVWQPNMMIPGVQGEEPFLLVYRGKLYLFFIDRGDRYTNRLGYVTYEKDGLWSATQTIKLRRAINDFAICLNPADGKLNIIYVAKENQMMFHLVNSL